MTASALQWILVDLLTGNVICDLPSVLMSDALRRVVGQYQSSSITLVVTDNTDPAWENIVQRPGGVAMVCYTGGPGQEVVQWGGIVAQAPRELGNKVVVSLITPEGYLDRRFVGNYSCTNKDQNQIVSDLVTQFAADTGGLPITVQVVGSPGVARTETYYDYDDKTVYSTLQDLMGVQGGPEWSMHWQWNGSGSTPRVTPVLYVGTRLGVPAQDGMDPAVTFETTQLSKGGIGADWTSGKGANIVQATTGQGAQRLTSGPITNNDPGRPKYEHRFSPSTSVVVQQTLIDHATAQLASMQNGAQPVTLVAPLNQTGYALGVDWNIGDDIGFSLTGPTYPNPVEGVARCIGYEVTNTTVTPILLGDRYTRKRVSIRTTNASKSLW